MLHIFKFFLILLVFPVFGQDDSAAVYSIYFDSNVNPGTAKITAIPEKYFGTYGLIVASEMDLRGAAGDNLIVDETGVYLMKNRVLSISREEIRENSQYTIRDEYLHGVLKNDSVLVSLEGELYYFLIPKKTYLYEFANSETKIYEGSVANEALIFSKEDNGNYSAIYVSFQSGKILLKELNFDQEQLDFRTLKGKKKELNGVTTYVLNPTKSEWKLLMAQFIEYDRYSAIAPIAD